MKISRLVFYFVVLFLFFSSIQTFAEPPLISVQASSCGAFASAQHTVTVIDIMELNAGSYNWNLNGSKTCSYPYMFRVKVNGQTVYASQTPPSMQIQLNAGDVVELILDILTGGGGGGSGSAQMEITIG